jgi:hypothetical protein
MVGTYANMMGVDARYRLFTHRAGFSYGFFLRAIGMPAFDDTLFDSGRRGFRYDAVVNLQDERTWDATRAVAGDRTPDARPHLLQLVPGMEPVESPRALSSQWNSIGRDSDDRVRIR